MSGDQERQPLINQAFPPAVEVPSQGSSSSILHTVLFNEEDKYKYRPEASESYQRMDSGSLLESPRILYCLHGDDLTACQQGCSPLEMAPPLTRRKTSSPDPHCHVARNAGINKVARRKLIMASVLCLVFMLAEIAGGYLSNSIAIATDAAHLLADFASFMISLLSLFIASRPANRRMSFGWHRAEVMGALLSVLLIWVVTGILLYMAIERVITRNFELDAFIMLVTSALGLLVNIIMGCTLHQHGHSHGGGGSSSHHNHHHSHENINVRAAFIHVVGDFLQSIGVLIAALVIYYKPEWSLVDPICTFIFSVFVLATTIHILRDTVNVLMEGIPKGIDIVELQQLLENITGVLRVHDLRVWSLSLDKPALSAHLVIAANIKPQEVLTTATLEIRAKYDFFEMTLQIEEFHEEMRDCNQCQNSKSPSLV